MKKLLLVLLCLPLFSFSQIKDFDSDKNLLVYDDGNQFIPLKIYYNNGIDNKDKLFFSLNKQIVLIKLDRLAEFGELYEKGMNKAIEWYNVAQENNVLSLDKDVDWTFKTDGGVISEAYSQHYSKPKTGSFKVSIELEGISPGNNYRYRVNQTDEHNVYSAFADIGMYVLTREKDLENAKKLIDFCKNYEKYVNEAIDKFNSIDNLFE